MNPQRISPASTITGTNGQHCTITVQLNPPAGSGTSYNATLSIFDNDPTSPQTVAITGKN
jgi:hypothetical protein